VTDRVVASPGGLPPGSRAGRLGLFAGQLGRSLAQPEFWAYSSWLDIVIKYRRTRLGLLWLVAPTAVFLLVLGNVYSHLMRVPIESYLPYLGVGYVCWRFMLQCINESSTIFKGHKAFIMDGRVRLTDFILRAIAKPLFVKGFALLVVICILVWSPVVSWSGILSMALTLPVIVFNMVWLSFCVALFGARFPDTGELIGTILVVGFLLTPILWHVDRFPPDTTRGFVARLNPAYHLIEFVRAPVLGTLPEPATLWFVGVLTVGGWVAASVLYRRYARFVPLWI
jgi:ABC-type polysaccharide/polyol phosphate export permease